MTVNVRRDGSRYYDHGPLEKKTPQASRSDTGEAGKYDVPSSSGAADITADKAKDIAKWGEA